MAYMGFEFNTHFPDDRLERGEGEDWEVVHPSGMALADAISELLRSTGLPVTEPESDLDHYCWVFAVSSHRKLFWAHVYDLGDDERFIMVKGSSPLLKGLFNRRDRYLELLDTLHGLLRGDPRFDSVRRVDHNRNPIAE